MITQHMHMHMFVLFILVMGMATPVWSHGGEKHSPQATPPIEAAEERIAPTTGHHAPQEHMEAVHHAHAPAAAPRIAEASWPQVLLWLPPLHPLLVHFPVALLSLAGLCGLLTWRQPSADGHFTWLRGTLYVGTAGALFALASGLYFETFVAHQHGGAIDPVMAWHERFGITTTISAVLLSAAAWFAHRRGRPWQRPIAALAVGLALLVACTSHLGGILVHRFGVGV